MEEEKNISMLIAFDYFCNSPQEELQSALARVPVDEFAKFGSLKGRVVCAWKLFYHSAAIALKPTCYCALAAMMYIADQVSKDSLHGQARRTLLTGIVSPLGQSVQALKAALGILHPGIYFKENELNPYFAKLAKIAEECGCTIEFVTLLKNAPVEIAQMFQYDGGGARGYYLALFQKDLAKICAKLEEPHLSKDKKISILKMFEPVPGEIHSSGVHACAPGLGRLLEQICSCLDVPKDLAKVVPWLVVQYKEEILNKMIYQIESSKTDSVRFMLLMAEKMDASHFGNLLISMLGKKIGLPQESIDSASQDIVVKLKRYTLSEQEMLYEMYSELFTEKGLHDYLIGRINSQPDGSPGLKNLRNYMIQKLAEQVTEEELNASKKEVQEKLGISEDLADDPSFYVKLHYYLYPDAKPSDEKSSDLNEKGIRAFMNLL